MSYFNEKTILYYKGEYLNAINANVNLYSQSLHYGYAVFEGIRSYNVNGKPKIFKAKEHFERLHHSCKTVHIPFDYSLDRLEEIAYQVLTKNNFTNAYLRPLVICSPNMALTKGVEAYLVMQAWEWEGGYLSNNIKIMTSSYQRPNPKGFHITAKVAGHYVNSIMASQEAKDKGFNEAMLLDAEGFVAEASGANIFFEKDGIIYTPPKGAILPGITRATVMDLASRFGITVIEKLFKPEEMEGADAGFFCGTAAEVVALESLNNIPFSKNWDTTSCALLQKAYQSLVIDKEFKIENIAV
jgi:branched-chain amino acid aminotransferase